MSHLAYPYFKLKSPEVEYILYHDFKGPSSVDPKSYLLWDSPCKEHSQQSLNHTL